MSADGSDGRQSPMRRRLRTGRQERRPGEPRQVRHVVKVSVKTEQRLIARAAGQGVTVARLLVESALAGDSEAARLKALLVDELFGVQRLLGRVGVNINQIARATNTTLEWQADTGPAIEEFGRVCARLDALLRAAEREVHG